ncbi:MAG: HesA/MoeB/ThiF family protein [Planctomycetota bacterium]|nr:HesA/MoeB/ThiF family protein [Planctomycetota bacterium]
MSANEPLTVAERAAYEWQLGVPDFGEEGQRKLKGASVLVSRLGGLGGVVAYELAAAGVGRLVLAHGGDVVPSDLNRQLLMTHEWIGRPRIECATVRLRELNPRLKVEAVGENVHEDNIARLVGEADLVVDCAPLFDERFLMNREAVRQNKPMVECAMYELEAHLTTIQPGKTPCLACLFPEDPPAWRRKFPVFGAVSGAVGCLAAMEAIKVIAGFGEPLHGRLLSFDTRSMAFHTGTIHRRPDCPVCSGAAEGPPAGA